MQSWAYRKKLLKTEKQKAYQKAWVAKNRKHVNAKSLARYHKHKEEIKTHPSRSPEARRRAYLKWRHQLSVEEYNQRVADQNSQCAICKRTPYRLCVDHDHDTGALRSLLCDNCNAALGHVREDPAVLTAMIQYIKNYKDKDDGKQV